MTLSPAASGRSRRIIVSVTVQRPDEIMWLPPLFSQRYSARIRFRAMFILCLLYPWIYFRCSTPSMLLYFAPPVVKTLLRHCVDLIRGKIVWVRKLICVPPTQRCVGGRKSACRYAPPPNCRSGVNKFKWGETFNEVVRHHRKYDITNVHYVNLFWHACHC